MNFPNYRMAGLLAFALLGAGAVFAASGSAAIAPAKFVTAKAARPWDNRKLSPDQRTALLLAAMTREEKLTLVFGYFGTDFPSKNYIAPAGALQGSAGFVPGIPRLGLAPQWQTDAGVGVASQGGSKDKRARTALPSGVATTATWDPALGFAGGAMIGSEARSSGFNVMLAGGVDLQREPRNGRNFEYGGEDPLLAGTMVGSQIAGIQSNHVISTLKHYAVNDQETDRDHGNSVLDQAAMRMSDLLAFEIALERGKPGSVMCSYNKVNGDHSCENAFLLTQVLRKDWGFKGYVMSDWGGAHSTAKAANAGLDQDSGFPFDDQPYFGKPLADAVAKGEVSPARLDQMAGRILRSMFALGVYDHPVAASSIDLAAHREVTRRDAEAGAVLLRNAGGVLPLSGATRRIAVIGGHADKGVLSGGGSSQVYTGGDQDGGNAVPGLTPSSWPGPIVYYPSSPLAELRKAMPKTQIDYADGTDRSQAVALAKQADLVIVFANQWAGESFDVSLTLPDDQDGLIGAVSGANPRTVVILQTGGPVLLPWAEQTAAILEAWYPGSAGGEAIANLLTGKANPSGHLPMTFPMGLNQLPHPEAPHAGDTVYSEGAAVGYKWFDAKGLTPRYPFGFGLSYTSFAASGLTVKPAGAGLVASVTVKNTGTRAGADVVQIYVEGAGWEAPRRLGGFKRVMLAPGQSTRLQIPVDPRLLAVWRDGWRISAGNYRVYAAQSSRELSQAVEVKLAARTLPGR